MKMTLDEYTNLTDTDKAFLKLEGRCVGCGCDMNMKFMNSPLLYTANGAATTQN